MSAPQKLTKKQKKGLAFRERKGKGIIKDDDTMDNDVPVPENQDLAEVQTIHVEVETSKKSGKRKSEEQAKNAGKGESAEKGKGKGKKGEGMEMEMDGMAAKPGKRKREAEQVEADEGGAELDKPKQKRKKEAAALGAGAKKEEIKQRFILFVGNLKYTTSLETIKQHFEACDPPPTVRLLTPKPGAAKRPISKSKGCAFLEFSHRNALQQALKLHQSEIEGRRINVELTAGGGGKSENRITKVRERNKELDEQRKQRIEKQVASENGEQVPFLPDRPQRYSATSGLVQTPAVKRTWTVGDVDDDRETHRGGRKHVKDRKVRGKVWGTGVNAIPVG